MEFCLHFGQFVCTVHKHLSDLSLALHFLQNSTPFLCKNHFCSSKTVDVIYVFMDPQDASQCIGTSYTSVVPTIDCIYGSETVTKILLIFSVFVGAVKRTTEQIGKLISN